VGGEGVRTLVFASPTVDRGSARVSSQGAKQAGGCGERDWWVRYRACWRVPNVLVGRAARALQPMC